MEQQLKHVYDLSFSQLKDIFSHYDVVSFDIFDTLLIRPFINPRDVWRFIEQKHHTENFYNARATVDSVAYSTYDEQYQHMPKALQNLKDIEIQTEKQLLCLNKFFYKLWNLAGELRKTRVITSDMYLSSKILEDILNSHGIFGWSRLNVSCETKTCKYDGSTYEKLKHEFPKAKILHIGDNFHCDVEIAQKHGINALYSPNVIHSFINNNVFAQKLLAKDQSLKMNSLVSCIAIAEHNFKTEQEFHEIWSKLGMQLGSVVTYAFIKLIFDQTKKRNLTDLLFVLRDGYSLKKAFDQVNTLNVKTHYVYAPRIVNYCENEELKTQHKNYVKSLDVDLHKSALVDCVTAHFTAQQLFTLDDFEPLAFILMSISHEITNGCALLPARIATYWTDLFEFLFTAPFSSIECVINNKPVFKNDLCIDEIFKMSICKYVSDAEIAGAIFVFEKMKQLEFSFDYNEILEYFMSYLRNLTQTEKDALKRVTNSFSAWHTDQHPIFDEKYLN